MFWRWQKHGVKHDRALVSSLCNVNNAFRREPFLLCPYPWCGISLPSLWDRPGRWIWSKLFWLLLTIWLTVELFRLVTVCHSMGCSFTTEGNQFIQKAIGAWHVSFPVLLSERACIYMDCTLFALSDSREGKSSSAGTLWSMEETNYFPAFPPTCNKGDKLSCF